MATKIEQLTEMQQLNHIAMGRLVMAKTQTTHENLVCDIDAVLENQRTLNRMIRALRRELKEES